MTDRKYTHSLVLLLTLSLLLCTGQASAAVHTVSQGESLYKISRWYGTTVQELQRANNLKSHIIYPGQRLFIPDRKVYTVQRGDTLYKIAVRFGTTYRAIMSANGLRKTTIYPGQKLYIPSGYAVQNQVSRGLPPGVSLSDFDLLARLITAEADDQSYETKVAVGAVVLNRVRSSMFPNSIRGVIYQVDESGRYQFEPVLNGWINRPASYESRQAAKDALNGWDPSWGALFFWESWVKNSFLNSRPVSRVLGAFTFTY